MERKPARHDKTTMLAAFATFLGVTVAVALIIHAALETRQVAGLVQDLDVLKAVARDQGRRLNALPSPDLLQVGPLTKCPQACRLEFQTALDELRRQLAATTPPTPPTTPPTPPTPPTTPPTPPAPPTTPPTPPTQPTTPPTPPTQPTTPPTAPTQPTTPPTPPTPPTTPPTPPTQPTTPPTLPTQPTTPPTAPTQPTTPPTPPTPPTTPPTPPTQPTTPPTPPTPPTTPPTPPTQPTTPATPPTPPTTPPTPPTPPTTTQLPYQSSCQKYKNLGYSRSVIYPLLINGEVINVYCDMDTDGKAWAVIQRHQDGATNFDRTYEEFRNPFGNFLGSTWLGLDNMHKLTASGQTELRVDLQRHNGQKAYAVYSQFSVGPASDNYRLQVSGYKGTAGDSLHFHNGMQFSTKEADHDLAGWNCAAQYNTGWWYHNCHSANLNNDYYGSAQYGIIWRGFADWEPLKSAEMKIRNPNE